MKKILRCCGTYTLKEICQKCGSKSKNIAPAKYSPEDRYAKYRREAKLAFYKKEGLI